LANKQLHARQRMYSRAARPAMPYLHEWRSSETYWWHMSWMAMPIWWWLMVEIYAVNRLYGVGVTSMMWAPKIGSVCTS